jgi:predicted acetyltransferase
MNNVMNIRLEEVSLDQKPVLERLMELYLHDFSEFDQGDIGPDGLYGYDYLDSYWTESDRHAFIVYVNDQIAGFLLVNKIVILDKNIGAFSIAEFFIMRKHRRKGIGRQTAILIFNRFPGRCEISQEAANKPSQILWKNVINEYTGGKFSEEDYEHENSKCRILSFCNDK